jgi:phenylalanyl-tRNA synthetase beta chain
MLGHPQDVVADLSGSQSIELRKARPAEILGVEVDEVEINRVLDGLGYTVVDAVDHWTCTVPYWRWLDTTREIDLVEEIGRVHGLDRVPQSLPRIQAGIGGLTREQRIRRLIEDHLAGMGLREVVTLSLVDPADRASYGLAEAEPVVLRNPLSADLSELRVSLLPSLLEVVRRNRAVGTHDIHAFEVGRVYQPGGEGGLADERPRLGVVLAGTFGGSAWTGDGPPADFGSIAAVSDALLARLGITGWRDCETDQSLLHPGRAARIVADGAVLGVLGEIHPGIAINLDLAGPIALAEFDLDALCKAVPSLATFGDISSFPPVRQDIAVIVSSDVEARLLVATIHDVGGELVTGAEVFDVFADTERLGPNRVSLAIHLTFQADDRTLTEDEATHMRDRIVAALVEVHGAELRG